MNDPVRRKLLSATAHLSIFFSPTLVSIAVPVAVAVWTDDPVVKENAREAINFHLAVWLAFLVALPLVLVLIGIPLLALVWAASCLLPLVAALSVLLDPGRPFVYPVSVRLI